MATTTKLTAERKKELYELRRVKTGKVRINFQSLFKKKAKDDGSERYEVMLLIPKTDTKTLEAMKRALEAGAELSKFGSLGEIKELEGRVNPLRDGDTEKDKKTRKLRKEDYPYYAGHYFLTVGTANKPEIVDVYQNEVVEGQLKDGDYVRIVLDAYAYDTKGNIGMTFGMAGPVLKVADGEALGGGKVKATDAFADDFEEATEESSWD